ncbi:hypothetical protein TYRP_003374 [Tyrophagus putrescentiae]|nr:hypothetical protein TYRP_003374 [Tyrophagus putrescentiae]
MSVFLGRIKWLCFKGAPATAARLAVMAAVKVPDEVNVSIAQLQAELQHEGKEDDAQQTDGRPERPEDDGEDEDDDLNGQLGDVGRQQALPPPDHPVEADRLGNVHEHVQEHIELGQCRAAAVESLDVVVLADLLLRGVALRSMRVCTVDQSMLSKKSITRVV